MLVSKRLIKFGKSGSSRAVIVPADWLRHYERMYGKPIEKVLLEVSDVITISVENDNPAKY